MFIPRIKVKGHWLWFVEPMLPSLLTSRVVEFDEFVILLEVKEFTFVDNDLGVCK